MAQTGDTWLVRLPDGRVIRARSTEALRRHLETGRIPSDSRIRRSTEEDWATFEWTPEFADLANRRAAKPTPETLPDQSFPEKAASRRSPAGFDDELRPVGVRGMVEELFTALDSSLAKGKLWVGFLAGLLGGIVFLLASLSHLYLDLPTPMLPKIVGTVCLMVIAGLATGWLSQATFLELSHVRSVTLRQAVNGMGRPALRLTLGYLVVLGSALLLIVVLREAGDQVLEQRESLGSVTAQILGGIILVLRLLLDVIFWPLTGLVLLLGPVVVIEDSSVLRSLGHWMRLLRANLSRVVLNEALAAALGAVITLPVLFPVFLAASTLLPGEPQRIVAFSALSILAGIALTPLITYLIVANVYIYLNLRYEFSPGGRKE